MGELKAETKPQQPNLSGVTATTETSSTSPPSPSSPVSASPREFAIAHRLFWGCAFVVTALLSATMGSTLAWMMPLPTAIAPYAQREQFSIGDLWRRGLRYQVSRPVNVLVMGIDEVLETPENSLEAFSGRTDTMLLVRVDPESDVANILSIPRDTRVDVPGNGNAKINHANFVGGPELAARTVSRNLNGVTVDRYVRVNTAAFREIVDLLGGVEVFVPNRMYYVDNTQGLRIDLEEGRQVLNGEQAEQFARFRNDGFGDIGRVQRQQQLIRALRERLLSPAVIPKLPQAIRIIQKYVDTNLTVEEMLALVNFGLELERDNLRMVMLPGRFSSPEEYIASYWLLDTDGRDRVMQEFFQVEPTYASVRQQRSLYETRIAIQNASGRSRAARQVARYLQEQGFYNVYTVNDWAEIEQETEVIAQQGDLNGARALATVLGSGRAVAASTGDIDSELTIRVGEDWSEPAED